MTNNNFLVKVASTKGPKGSWYVDSFWLNKVVRVEHKISGWGGDAYYLVPCKENDDLFTENMNMDFTNGKSGDGLDYTGCWVEKQNCTLTDIPNKQLTGSLTKLD